MAAAHGPGGARRLIILGATGSIGAQTIEVVRALGAEAARKGEPAPIEIVGLAAGRDAAGLLAAAEALGVRELALADSGASGSEVGGARRPGAGSADLRAGHHVNLRRGP